MLSVLRPVAALHLSMCKIDGLPLLTSMSHYRTTESWSSTLREKGSSFSHFDKVGVFDLYNSAAGWRFRKQACDGLLCVGKEKGRWTRSR